MDWGGLRFSINNSLDSRADGGVSRLGCRLLGSGYLTVTWGAVFAWLSVTSLMGCFARSIHREKNKQNKNVCILYFSQCYCHSGFECGFLNTDVSLALGHNDSSQGFSKIQRNKPLLSYQSEASFQSNNSFRNNDNSINHNNSQHGHQQQLQQQRQRQQQH